MPRFQVVYLNKGGGGGAQIWNNLPKDLKTLQTYNSFKRSTKVYVQNKSILIRLFLFFCDIRLCIRETRVL